jgi:hypothetical protein
VQQYLTNKLLLNNWTTTTSENKSLNKLKTVTNAPSNKKIDVQRKFYSTTKKRKRKVRYAKPTQDEKKQLFVVSHINASPGNAIQPSKSDATRTGEVLINIYNLISKKDVIQVYHFIKIFSLLNCFSQTNKKADYTNM